MEGSELYRVFVGPLEESGFDYMVTGSVASSSYGEPRFTFDIDIVLVLTEEDLDAVRAAFPESGFYLPPTSVMREEIGRERDGHFNLIHNESGFKADIYPSGQDPLHLWALARRVRVPLEGDNAIWLAPPEYVILRKLEFLAEGGGERHSRDIRAMLEVSSPVLDLPGLESWIHRMGLDEIWSRMKP